MKANCIAKRVLGSGVAAVKGAGHVFRMATIALAVALVTYGSAFATDPPPLLPDTGIEWDSLVAEAATALGSIVVVIIGAFLAFKLVKIGMSWLGKLGG